MGYRQVLHGCEAGGQWLLQGAGYCFHQEVAWFFPEIAKFLPSSPHTTFSARGSLDIGSRPNVRWACFTDNKHILFFQWLPLWYDSNSKRGALQDCRFYAGHQGKGGSALTASREVLARHLFFFFLHCEVEVMSGWMNEWSNERSNERKIKWSRERLSVWMNERMNEWMVIVTTCTVACSLANDWLIFL